uniref:Uncharacterized protein n=1 Tax=Ditylenchus dipsaci TaxID=166011 RepID=A0A915D468_9BILA
MLLLIFSLHSIALFLLVSAGSDHKGLAKDSQNNDNELAFFDAISMVLANAKDLKTEILKIKKGLREKEYNNKLCHHANEKNGQSQCSTCQTYLSDKGNFDEQGFLIQLDKILKAQKKSPLYNLDWNEVEQKLAFTTLGIGAIYNCSLHLVEQEPGYKNGDREAKMKAWENKLRLMLPNQPTE